jgi:hypothetical protein
MYKIAFIISCLCGLQLSVTAQTVQGNIRGKDSLPLPGVFIQNIHSKVYSVSNGDGYFSISASPLDTLLFKAPGHLPIAFRAIALPAILYMRPQIVQLAGVEIVRKTHKEDSLALRQEFGKNFNFRRPKFYEVVTIMPTGIGINIFQLYHALSFKNNKRQTTFKNRLLQYEQEQFVNQFFTKELVTRYSGLQGDSLNRFMLLNKPSFQFMKDASQYDVLLHIKQAVDSFRKG